MGRGSSKIGKGGGGAAIGAQAQKVANPMIQSLVNALNSPGRWTQRQRDDLSSAIYASTDVGDRFVVNFQNGSRSTITKTSANTWEHIDENGRVLANDLTAARVRDVLLIYADFGKISFE